MNQNPIIKRSNPFATLRRLARPPTVQEKCELCCVPLAPDHRHLFEMSKRQVVCACEHCAMRFQAVVDGRFKLIPRYPYTLPNFRITDVQWESLALPINLAFFFHSTTSNKMTVLYPSPGGAIESLLPLTSWTSLMADNPPLATMEADVEALLINRVGTERKYYLVPIDLCFELVGVIRLHWRGLSGGDSVWEQLDAFFARLDARCEPFAEAQVEASHA